MSATKSIHPPPEPERLNELYTTMGLGCPDIGWLYDRDPKTVHYWLRKAGIPTRARGMDPRQWFAKGGDPRSFSGTKHSAASKAKIGAASRGRAPYLRDGVHWLHTVPADKNPNWKGGATPERQEFYRSIEWKAAVKAVWRRDNGCCRRCALDWRTVDSATTPTFHIHHIVSFAVVARRAATDNLVLLCRPCHHWVHSNKNADRQFLAALDEENAR